MSAAENDQSFDNPYLNKLHRVLKASEEEATLADSFTNPILALSLAVAQDLQSSEITLNDLHGSVNALNTRSLSVRAHKFKSKIGEFDSSKNCAKIRDLLNSLAKSSDFEAFSKKMEKLTYGVVFTAHPTFTLTEQGYNQLCALIHGEEPLDALTIPDGVTLDEEFDFACHAINSARTALKQILQLVFEVAAHHWPDRIDQFNPQPLNIANWVGFDLDGRSDITWQSSFIKRLKMAENQQQYYLEYLDDHLSDLKVSAPEEFARLHSICTQKHDIFLRQIDIFTQSDDINTVHSELEKLDLSVLQDMMPILQQLLQQELSPEIRRNVQVLRSLVTIFDEGNARIHVRLNSTQIHNAVRSLIDMERDPDESLVRRNYLQRISDKLDDVKPHDVTVLNIEHEPTTARRLFMLISLMKKYIAPKDRVRFLIAETESSFTQLSALYFARFFNVEINIDISPLFETDVALLKADKVIAELLENNHYRDYVEKTGRLCIQVGYSDAGRFVGQISASMAIERLKMKLLNLMEKEKLTHIELVFFDTHGESVGRGGGHSTLNERIDYFTPPHVRDLAAKKNISFIQETSFQGGDGFLFFENSAFALATFTRVLETLWSNEHVQDDSFYREEDATLEFFLNLKTFNSDLVDNPNYAKLLGMFAQHFLYSTGSRAVKRQHEGTADRQLDHPSQIRAIPNNAILQQLGYLANSIGGVGCSFKKNMDQLVKMHSSSHRLQTLLEVANKADSYSDIDILGAYVSVIDPMIWLKRAVVEKDRNSRSKMRRIVRHLENDSNCDALRSIERLLLRDNLDFKRCVQNISENNPHAPISTDHDDHSCLRLLHAIRIGVMFHCLQLYMAIPRFSNRPHISMEVLYTKLFHFDIQHALSTLEEAFPHSRDEIGNRIMDEDISYDELHTTTFHMLHSADQLFKKITIGIANKAEAIG
jgi:phosphoenolpyruvate carboxylase